MRRLVLIVLSLAAMACGAESPTRPPFGEELSVAEQVAVEAAFLKVVDSLEAENTTNDSLIADFTTIAARLVRLQGRYGTINVTLPGATGAVTMRAIAGTGSDATISSENVSFLLAWQDLDVAEFTVKRALIIQKGGFESLVADQVRYFDMTGATSSGYYVGGGTLTLSAPSFTTACEGIGSAPGAICRAGKVTVAATTSVSKDGIGTPSDVNFTAMPIAGFEVIVE